MLTRSSILQLPTEQHATGLHYCSIMFCLQATILTHVML